MSRINAFVLIAIVFATAAALAVGLAPARRVVTTTVTTYDTVHMVIPYTRNGEPLRLCTEKIRYAIDGLAETSLWHDVPAMVAEACGALKQGYHQYRYAEVRSGRHR